MPTAHVRHIEQTADDLVDKMNQSQRIEERWQIRGRPTAGKSTVLRMLAPRLRAEGKVPLLINPPQRALDAAQVAMIQVAGALKDAGRINGELESFAYDAQAPWDAQHRQLREWLDDNADDVVILCDEPARWVPGRTSLRHFSDKTRSIISLLLDDIACKRVIAGDTESPRSAREITIPSERNYQSWLCDSDHWGTLADSAHQLWNHFTTTLDELFPLELRLLVAINHLSAPPDVERLIRPYNRGSISQTLISHLQNNDSGVAVLKTWGKCTLVREDIDRSLLNQLVDDSIAEPYRDILTRTILYPRDDDSFVLHELLRHDANKFQNASGWISGKEAQRTHRRIADHYAGCLEEASANVAVRRALRCEMEGFHHATIAGDENIEEKFRPFFVEQLNLLGRHLSKEEDRHEDAVDVFQRAVQRDDTNDYSHHYLAFNLDVQGIEPDRVREHYQLAIDHEPEHAWWWSRWICFLITRGRIKQAREQWSEALDVLSLPDESAPISYYDDLHKWVSRLLLHRGKLNFAEQVLRSVPTEIKQPGTGFDAMHDLLYRLQEARDKKTVFPSHIPIEQRWKSPALHPETHDGRPLVRWLPARVEATDPEPGDDVGPDHQRYIHLVVAVVDGDDGEPQFGRMRIPHEDYNRWSQDLRATELTPGRFLELAVYGDRDDDPVIRVHPRRPSEPPALPPLRPDPARYLRKANRVR